MKPTTAQLLRAAGMAKQARRYPEARAALDEALALNPGNLSILIEKSRIELAFGDPDAARRSALQATRVAPTSADAHAQLGLAFLDLKKLANAESSLKTALQYDRNCADANAGYARLRLRQKRSADAEPFAINALRARPADPDLCILLGDVFAARGNRTGMIEAYRRARDLDLLNTEARDKYLAATGEAGGVDATRAALEVAVARMPDSPEAHLHLGKYLSGHGLLDDAAASFRRALALSPADHAALQYLAESKTFRSADDPDLGLIRRGYADNVPGSEGRAIAAFAVAKALDDIGQHDGAFDAYLEANETQRRSIQYTLDVDRRDFAAIAAAFSAELLKRLAGSGSPSEVPIFIVGMPRSGTTLVETILSRHRDVFAAGELEGIRAAANGVVGVSVISNAQQFVERLDAPKLRRIGESYIELLGDAARKAPRVTDKLPHNFRLIGLIRLAFPEASIVHIRRDPLDNCLSIFKANFLVADHPYTADLTEIGRYYNLYRGLMEHWRGVLPGGFFEIDYEALVSGPEAATRRLFEYCRLDWSPDVLDIGQNRREVRTISFAQVRRSINTDSVRAADRYGARLDPLRAALAEWPGD